MPKKTSSKKNVDKSHINETSTEKLANLSRDELHELLMINTYKLALTRAQIDAIMEILIKKGITTYDEVWKKTNEIFKATKKE